MFRSILTLALSVFLLAEASAQTTPGTIKKTSTKATARTTRRAAKKVRKVASRLAPIVPARNDGWGPIEEAQTAVASTATGNSGWAAAASSNARSNGGEIDNANVYASPGMPVHIRTSNGMVPYSVRPPRKPSASTQTTLSN